VTDLITQADALACALSRWDEGVWLSLERVRDVLDQRETPPTPTRTSARPGDAGSYWVAELRDQPDGLDSQPIAEGVGATPEAALFRLVEELKGRARKLKGELDAAMEGGDRG